MTNFEFSGKIGGQYVNFTRISKTSARKYFEQGRTIYLQSSNFSPIGVWSSAFPIHIAKHDDNSNGKTPLFDRYVNNFEHYNCANSETGTYASFYIDENEEPYQFVLLDHCVSDYFPGHHLPVIVVPVYKNMTGKQVLESIKSELNKGYAQFPEWQEKSAIAQFKAENDLRKIFINADTEGTEDCDDFEPANLYYTIGVITNDRVIPGMRYAYNPFLEDSNED